MKEEQPSKSYTENQKRKTIKIRVPRKPAAPVHSTAFATQRTLAMATSAGSALARDQKKSVWSEVVLFPFRIYMLLAPIGLFLWHELILGNRVQVAFADATQGIVLGYLLCITAFMLAAAICFVTRRWERVAENLVLAGIAFVITYFILPWCAGS